MCNTKLNSQLDSNINPNINSNLNPNLNPNLYFVTETAGSLSTSILNCLFYASINFVYSPITVEQKVCVDLIKIIWYETSPRSNAT